VTSRLVPNSRILESMKEDNQTRKLTKQNLATLLGVSPRTVNRWLEQHCPHSRDERDRPMFNAEEVRAWRAAREADQDSQRASIAKAELVRKVTIAHRNELALAAERGLKDLDLGERIRAAKTHEDLVEISKEVGALLGSGALSPARGRAIQALMAEARHNMREHREAEGEEDPESLILVTLDGARLLRSFEGIVSDDRRASILQHVDSEAQLDLQEHPNVDLARVTEPTDTEPEATA